MSKHTPGPWNVAAEPVTRRHPNGERYSATEYMIGTPSDAAHGYDPPELRETAGALVAKSVIRENDARLISAAPDLLEAAKVVVFVYEGGEEEANEEGWSFVEIDRRSLDALRAAIAKAEGGDA